MTPASSTPAAASAVHEGTSPKAPQAHARNLGAMLIALAAIALGGFVIHAAVTGPNGQSYAFVGPGVFPLIIGLGFVLVGLGLLREAWHGTWRVTFAERAKGAETATSADTPSPAAKVLLIALAFVLDVALIEPLGFVPASTALFVCVTRAFGSRRPWLDIALGLAFTGSIFVVFAHGLGLALPAGRLWEGLGWTF